MVTLDQIVQDLQNRHARLKSWRKAGEPYGISGAMARLIAGGTAPGPKTRLQLGLAPTATVVVVAPGGAVPEGAQVIGALFCALCEQPFIPNHPRRRRCYICSPFRGAKRHRGMAVG